MANTPYRPLESRGPDEDRPNRAYQTRRDNDTFKTPKISIYDIDFAVMSWLRDIGENVVDDNGNLVNCPVMYANGERWSQIQANGGLRDSTGKWITPMMVIKRTGIEKDPRIDLHPTPAAGAGNMIILPNRSRSDQFDLLSKTQNSKKTIEYYITALPEFVYVRYDLIIWTDYVEQMNHIVQDIIPTSRFAWGDTWKFVTEVGDYDFTTEVNDSEDRVVQCRVPLTTQGVLLDEFEIDEAQAQKAFSTKRVVWNNEQSSFDVRVDETPPNGYDNDMREEARLDSFFQSLLNNKR